MYLHNPCHWRSWNLLNTISTDQITIQHRSDNHTVLWCAVLYDQYRTGGAFDPPMQSTINELAIMNTFFEKHSIYNYTWQHPGSGTAQCWDKHKHPCVDVSILHPADCWTDHKLLRAKLQLQAPWRVGRREFRKRYAVARLKDAMLREEYRKVVQWCIMRDTR